MATKMMRMDAPSTSGRWNTATTALARLKAVAGVPSEVVVQPLEHLDLEAVAVFVDRVLVYSAQDRRQIIRLRAKVIQLQQHRDSLLLALDRATAKLRLPRQCAAPGCAAEFIPLKSNEKWCQNCRLTQLRAHAALRSRRRKLKSPVTLAASLVLLLVLLGNSTFAQVPPPPPLPAGVAVQARQGTRVVSTLFTTFAEWQCGLPHTPPPTAPVTNPNYAHLPDPMNAALDCRLNIVAWRSTLPAGSGYTAWAAIRYDLGEAIPLDAFGIGIPLFSVVSTLGPPPTPTGGSLLP